MRYRKKPVVVEARELTKDSLEDVSAWCGGRPQLGHGNVNVMRILTLEGDMMADYGDYIIQGVKGEFYPCKPDIFELTYEAAE